MLSPRKTISDSDSPHVDSQYILIDLGNKPYTWRAIDFARLRHNKSQINYEKTTNNQS